MSRVGCLLSGRGGEFVPHGAGDLTSVRGRSATDGLHPHRPVPHSPAGRPARTYALHRHGQHTHDKREPPLGTGEALSD